MAAASAGAALATSLCIGCCVLPFTLPAGILAFAGGSIAMLDHGRSWVSILALVVVAFAWGWIAWQTRKTGRRIGRTTIAVISISTVLVGASLSWPLVKPWARHVLGAPAASMRQGN